MTAVSENGFGITERLVRPLGDLKSGQSTFKNDDVLFARITPCMENGKTAIARELTNALGFGSTEFHVLRAGPSILPQYLHHFLRRETFRAIARQHMSGSAGQQRLPDGFLHREPIPLPPLVEQRRIVDILDKVDRLRQRQALSDTKTAQLHQALFVSMFGSIDPQTQVLPLTHLLRERRGALQSGPFGTQLHNHDFVPSGPVLAVGIDNVLDGEFVIGRNRRITSEKYRDLSKYTLEPGDVLITVMGTVGRTCVFPGEPYPAICTKHVYRIQLKDLVDPEYMSATLRFSDTVRRQLGARVTRQTVSGIKASSLRDLELPVPPLRLQTAFATRKRAVDSLRRRATRARLRTDALLALLLDRAFSRELPQRAPRVPIDGSQSQDEPR